MRFYIFVLFLIILPICQASAGFYPIHRLQQHYGFYVSDFSFPSDESLMISKAEPLCSRGPAFGSGWHLSVRERAYFKETSCIAFYRLGADSAGYRIGVDGPERTCNLIFYNLCNSSIYTFGDSIGHFSEVFKGILLSHFDKKGILELINLFLETRISSRPYEILYTPHDFVRIYDHLFGDIAETRDDSLIEKIRHEREAVPSAIESLKWQEINGGYRTQFYTWGGLNSIDYWDYKITRQGIEILEEKAIFTKLGWSTGIR